MLQFLQASSEEGLPVVAVSPEGMPSRGERQGEELLQQESSLAFRHPSDNVPVDKADESD